MLFDEQAIYIGIVCSRVHIPNGSSRRNSRATPTSTSTTASPIVLESVLRPSQRVLLSGQSGRRARGRPDLEQRAELDPRLGRHLGRGRHAIVRRLDSRDRDSVQDAAIPPDQTVWGFNVERQIKHLLRNGPMGGGAGDESGSATWRTPVSSTGLEGARQGHGLDVRPYMSGGRDDGDRQFTGGLDVFKNLTPNLNARSRSTPTSPRPKPTSVRST